MMKEKLWNANYIKVMTTNFLLYFAFYLLTPLLPLYLSENFGATKGIFAAGLLDREPLEAEVDVRERRNPPLETEFFTISGPFLALLPKVNI